LLERELDERTVPKATLRNRDFRVSAVAVPAKKAITEAAIMLVIRAIVLRIACSSSQLSCKPDRRPNLNESRH
jgi:hypothetical protein